MRLLGGAKARGGLGGARVRVGRGKYSPTPYFCLLVGIQRAMATTSPRGVSGRSYSRSERCCSCRTLPPCSGKTWATLARPAASPPRRPASLAPGVPHARAARPPAVTCWGQRPRSPARPPRRRPGSSRWPRPLRPGRPPARLPRRLRLAQPSHSLELAAGSSGSSRGRLCGPQRSQAELPRAEEGRGGEAGESLRSPPDAQ